MGVYRSFGCRGLLKEEEKKAQIENLGTPPLLIFKILGGALSQAPDLIDACSLYVDASKKPDPTDSKCQYGYAIIMLAGGPIMTHSKKLSHVGLSAAQNEYMALQWCNRHVVWLRHLLVEMGYSDNVMVSDPTLVRGDNTAANQLCYEDIVASGNLLIIAPYHYNKEVVTLRLVEVKYVKTEDNLADLTTKADTVDRTTSARLTDRLAGYEPLTQEEAQG